MKYAEKHMMRAELQIKYRKMIYDDVPGMWISLCDDYEGTIQLDGHCTAEGLIIISDMFGRYLKELEPINNIQTED